jgi:hypothetical protein
MSPAKPGNADTAGREPGVNRQARTQGGERRERGAREALVQRVTAEFREMPCLRITAGQAERLFGLRADVSARIISTLVQQGLLRVDEEGRYAMADGS